MAHEIDKLDCNKALEFLDDIDDYCRMDIAVYSLGRIRYLKEFIESVELFQKKHIKQIPAILKKGSNGQQMY